MRERLWYELSQAKLNNRYGVFLISWQRRLINSFNIAILLFSSAGVMGWKLWNELPLVSYIIVSLVSILKLISPQLIPSEKEIDKLDSIAGFYFDYYN